MIGLQFVNDAEIDYISATETELCIKVCPFCGNSNHKMYVNKATGLYNCKVCGQSGNIFMLKAKYGILDDIAQADILHKQYKSLIFSNIQIGQDNLIKNKSAKEYLYSRGFTDKTIDFFKLGLKDEWILIPHVFEKELWNFKMRRWEGDKAFKRVSGQPTVLFNADTLNYDKKAIMLVESETDCMAAWQMGMENVVSLTGGAQSFKPEWLKIFNKFQQVYIVLNSDAPGQLGAKKIAEKIGFQKCYNAILPTKDVNDYLKEKQDSSFKKYVKDNAYKFTIKNVTQLGDYINKIDTWFDEDGSLEGISLSDFPRLNKILNGFKAEDLIILMGDSGVGKTTWVLNSVLQMIREDRRCLLFCLEGKIHYYILRMMSIQSGKKMEELRNSQSEWDILKDTFAEYPLYFYSGSQAEMDPKRMSELLPVATKLYDIEFVAIDNLQKFVKGAHDIFQRIGEAVSILKDLCVDLKIPILMISHITKRKYDSRSPITMHDAKSSSTIYQDADVVLIINVQKNGDYEIVVEKNRMGEGGMRIPISLNKNIAKYYETIQVPIENTNPQQDIENAWDTK
mgnify:CR=1 FL=1